MTDFGFRRRPYAWRAGVRGMVGTRSGDLGIRLTADRYLENSPWSLSLFAHATRLESNRFYGYGNDTERVDPSLSLIKRDELLVRGFLSTLRREECAGLRSGRQAREAGGSNRESGRVRRHAGQRIIRPDRRARGSHHGQERSRQSGNPGLA